MSTHPLEKFLAACRIAHATRAATKETAYYPVFRSLLDAAGGGLKPRVHCVMGLKDQGAGMPDGGFFTPDQFVRGEEIELKPGQVAGPSRGVVECKSLAEDVPAIAETDQVSRYWKHYNQVLVTNYRQFTLIGTDHHGVPGQPLEHYTLAKSEADFWALADSPKAAVAEHGDRLLDFLRRCLRRPAPLTEPKDLAWFLASYARDARSRIAQAADTGKLDTVRQALEEALGLHVADAEGEHFFQSTLVQTLFYGVFAAWVLWHRLKVAEAFDWEKASKYLHVPILRKLFRELTDPAQLEEWELTEVMNWAADTLDRVERDKFFARFNDAEAVQYFYEPFLEAFDPELRKQLGVWYTPPEVVKYMVGRVHQVLQESFDRPDGLADPGVFVLDPCCGTGAYLVEVLNTVAEVLKDKGEGALLAGRVKQAATERVFGFEILPAPFVVAHLQLGLLLQRFGAPLDEKRHDRAAVYLTNALTGWEPPTGPKQRLLFTEMEEERDKAARVKQNTPLLVVLGNPPYNGFAGLPAEEDKGLVDPYRSTVAAPKPEGQGLNDLYVRFFRVAERCITERGQQHGIVCYISNYSWLDGRSHTGLRERFLNEFDQIWIDCLNGDKYKTGKQTPDGKPDPSIFSTPHNREGIQVGTAIALLARTPKHTGPAKVRFRDFWGEKKREDLLASGVKFQPRNYEKVTPIQELGLAFRPMQTEADYTNWPLLPEVFPTTFPGIFTARDQFVVDIERESLRKRVAAYFDSKVSHEQMRLISPQSMEKANSFDPVPVREALRKRGMLTSNLVKFSYRPFDIRWLYWEPDAKLLNRCRADYVPHIFAGNLWLAATKQNRKAFDPPLVLRHHATLHIIERGANLFPLLLHETTDDGLPFADPSHTARRLGDHLANLSDAALAYLNRFRGVADAPYLFHHVIAVLHAPSYAEQNAAALRQDWPRVPLPASRAALLASAELGRQVAALLDPETPVSGVTTGKLSPAIKVIGGPARVGGGQLADAHLTVTARWGITGKGGITMPSTGKLVARPFTDEEKAALGDAGVQLLGPDACDVYLNDVAYWRNVPRKVWEYRLGGYQVLKKWLSYREKSILGRGLTLDEVAHVRDTARRIAALLLLGQALDANYEQIKADPFPWSR